MYKLPKDQRDLIIANMSHEDLQLRLKEYVDKEEVEHDNHRKRMRDYAVRKRKRDEESKLLQEEANQVFKCDWNTLSTFWTDRCKPNTVKAYRTAHQDFTEYAMSLPPTKTCPHRAFLDLMNMPNRVFDFIESMDASRATKISRLKYILNLIDNYPGMDGQVSAYSRQKLGNIYDHQLLLDIQEKEEKDDIKDMENIPFTKLLDDCKEHFGPLSLQFLFIRTMLDIPCRGDLTTMGIYATEAAAIDESAENYIVLPLATDERAFYKLTKFKTDIYAYRYTTTDTLSTELTTLLNDKRKASGIVDKTFYLFPRTMYELNRLMKEMSEALQVKISITILRHMLQKHAKETMSTHDYCGYNMKMLHGIKVGEEVYLK